MRDARDEVAAAAEPAAEPAAAAPGGRLRAALPLLIRLAISAALLALLFSKVPLGEVLALFGRARADIVLLSAVLFAISLLGSAYQWWLFLRAQRIAISFRQAMNFYLVGLFLNNFLPANVGGDVMKVIDVGRAGGTKAGALTATLLDRAMGLFVLVLAGTFAACALGDALPFPEMTAPLVLSSAALVILFVAVLSRRVARVVESILRHVPGARLRRLVERLIAHVRMLHDDRRIFLVAFAVSVVTQILRIAVHYLAAIALGVQVAPVLFALLVPVIAVAITLPISIGGFGVREGLGVVLFGRVGVGSTEALAFELLSHIVAVLVSLWGGALFILRGRSASRSRASEPARTPRPR